MGYKYEEAAEAFQTKLDGEWKVCPKTGVRLLLIHPAHPDYKRKLSALEREARSRLGLVGRKADHPLPGETQIEISNKALVEVLLKDWGELDDKDGNPVPYEPKKALSILNDPRNWVLQQDIGTVLAAMIEEESEEREVLSGNS